MLESEHVRANLEEHIGVITIDRPPVNAYSLQVHRDIYESLQRLEPVARCVVLAAAGHESGRPFSAGSDVNEFVGLTPKMSLERAQKIRKFMSYMNHYPLPVISAIENLAMGSGLGWAMRGDIRVGSVNAQFAMPEIKVGALGGGRILMRHVGVGKAREMIFTGDRISAEEAYRVGLIEHLVPPGEALSRALDIAGRIARNSPVGIRLAKKQMDTAELTLDLDEAYRIETELTAEYRASPAADEAARAFLEKRPPVFRQ